MKYHALHKCHKCQGYSFHNISIPRIAFHNKDIILNLNLFCKFYSLEYGYFSYNKTRHRVILHMCCVYCDISFLGETFAHKLPFQLH